MNLAGKIEWRWQRREQVPAPRAVVAWGRTSERLHDRLRRLAPDHQARLLATASGQALVVVGEAADMPWVDGAAYAAPSESAADLWLPTLWRPDVPEDLLARALHTRHGRRPMLLWCEPAAIVPLDRQLPLSEALLSRIAQHWNGAAA